MGAAVEHPTQRPFRLVVYIAPTSTAVGWFGWAYVSNSLWTIPARRRWGWGRGGSVRRQRPCRTRSLGGGWEHPIGHTNPNRTCRYSEWCWGYPSRSIWALDAANPIRLYTRGLSA